MDVRAPREATRVRVVDLVAAIDLDGDVLDADAVVLMPSAVRRAYAEGGAAVTEVDDLLGAPVGRVADVLRPPERPQQLEIERDRLLDVADAMSMWWNPLPFAGIFPPGCVCASVLLPAEGRGRTRRDR